MHSSKDYLDLTVFDVCFASNKWNSNNSQKTVEVSTVTSLQDFFSNLKKRTAAHSAVYAFILAHINMTCCE